VPISRGIYDVAKASGLPHRFALNGIVTIPLEEEGSMCRWEELPE